MFSIGALSEKTNVSTQTIRYYERINLLPPPKRAANGYRVYDAADVERLQFIRRSRLLDFTLDEIAEVLALRDQNVAPCSYVMDVMGQRMGEIEERIRDLEQLHAEVKFLYEAGQRLPEDVHMEQCVCHLIRVGGH